MTNQTTTHRLAFRIMTLLFTLALTGAAAHAQSACARQKAQVPFDFHLGGRALPAGTYTVTCLGYAAGKVALHIRSADGRAGGIVLMHKASGAGGREEARLVFNRYGDQYFLAQVWDGADNTGLEMPVSRAERTLRREAPREGRSVALLPRRDR